MYAAFRWLGPWLEVLAISAAIAHTAEAVFLPNVPAEPAQMLIVESTGVLEHVKCATDADGEVDVLVCGLQDLPLLEDGHCEVRL